MSSVNIRWWMWLLMVSLGPPASLVSGNQALGEENADSTKAYVLTTEWLSPNERKERRKSCLSCLETYNKTAKTNTDSCELDDPKPEGGPELNAWDCRQAYPVRVHPWVTLSDAPIPLRTLEVRSDGATALTSKSPTIAALLKQGDVSRALKGRGVGDLVLTPIDGLQSNAYLQFNPLDPIVIISSDNQPLSAHFSEISLVNQGHLYESHPDKTLWTSEETPESSCLEGSICYIYPMDYRRDGNSGVEIPQFTRLRLVFTPKTSPTTETPGTIKVPDPTTATPAPEVDNVATKTPTIDMQMLLRDLGYWSLLQPAAFYTLPINQGFFGPDVAQNLGQVNVVAGVNLITGTRYTQWNLMPERSFFFGAGLSNTLRFKREPDSQERTLDPTLLFYGGLSGGKNLNVAIGWAPWAEEIQGQDTRVKGAVFLLLGPRFFNPLVKHSYD